MATFDRNDTAQKVIAIIAEKLNIGTDKVHESSTLQDLGADSIDMVEIVMKTEELFGIEINDEKAEQLKNVQQVIDYVNQLRTK
jgi:acyl carrier protein